MRSCYYQGCCAGANTKEHIPPKSFFPKDQRDQLLTVPSCELHNNSKSEDDKYVLAHICLNASPANRSREVFENSVLPQLGENKDSLFANALREDAQPLPGGAVRYKVNEDRLNYFFSALSCGIVYKSCGKTLPPEFTIGHIYHNLSNGNETECEKNIREAICEHYSGSPMDFMKFGHVKTLNVDIYTAKIFGIPHFRSSITVVHEFFGTFRVASMLTRTC